MIDLPKPEVYQDTDTNFTKFWNIRNVLCDAVRIVISDRESVIREKMFELISLTDEEKLKALSKFIYERLVE